MRTGSHFRHPLLVIATAFFSIMILAACDSDDATDDVVTDDGNDIPVETVEPANPEEDSDPAVDDAQPEPTPQDLGADAADDAVGSERLQQLDLDLELYVEGLIQPTDMVPVTDGSDRLFVTSRIGTIHIIEDGELLEGPLLDLREQIEHEMVEQGLLSIALHPDFTENGYFYVNYISYGDENTIVSRFEMAEDGQSALPESETVIFEVEQPHYSHNGGNLKFGPDGYLYVGLGDGEDPGDPHEHSQNPGTKLGSILRIDVDGGDPYAIPEDNPFIGSEDGRDEVWAYGLRNPWRFSFDPATGDMFMVDVGQWAVEEVNHQPADSQGGENYGWPIMEGDQCWEADECDQDGLTIPVATYENPSQGCAVIGGYTYHGEQYPELEGIYFLGDWCSGNIWGLAYEDGEWVKELLIETDLMINAFGIDHAGEIYVLNFEEGGGVYRVIQN